MAAVIHQGELEEALDVILGPVVERALHRVLPGVLSGGLDRDRPLRTESVDVWAGRHSISRRKAYELVAAGTLPTASIGRRRVVLCDRADEMLLAGELGLQ